MPTLKKVVRVSLTACLGLLLSACQPGYDDQLSDYLSRLENILEVEPAKLSNVQGRDFSLPKLPSQRATQTVLSESEASTIGILEFMSLDECAIQQTIAAKNNNLGKVASASQQLLNTIAFIEQAPACIETLQANQRVQLQQKLEQSLQTKKQQLPALLWHATINGGEYRQFWKTSNIDFSYPQALPPQQVEALQDLLEFGQNVLATNKSSIKLEQTLGLLRQGDGGKLLAAFVHLDQQLHIANQMIQTALDQPFCQADNNNFTQPNIKILHNMMSVFFIPNIQRWANDLNKRYAELMPTIRQLDALFLAIEHPEIHEWRQQRDQLFGHARKATKHHVEMLNRLYEQCASSPQGKPLKTDQNRLQ